MAMRGLYDQSKTRQDKNLSSGSLLGKGISGDVGLLYIAGLIEAAAEDHTNHPDLSVMITRLEMLVTPAVRRQIMKDIRDAMPIAEAVQTVADALYGSDSKQPT